MCSLLEEEDVVFTGHVCSCYLYDVWVSQLAQHLELMLSVGVANLDGEEFGRIDLSCGVVLALADHAKLTPVVWSRCVVWVLCVCAVCEK